MISMTRYYKFQICSQEEEEEGISLFGRVPSVYVYLGYFSIGKKGKRETWVRREVNLFTLSINEETILFLFFLNRAFQEAAN